MNGINGPVLQVSPVERPTPAPAGRDQALRQAARDLEASFLAEMLKETGLGRAPEGFGGGVGEEQFASFLVQEQAKALTAAGGIGLSERIFQALSQRADQGAGR